jgi:hypothetical protein
MKVINIPRTQTILALGVLVGCFATTGFDWHDAMLMILTFYFTKHEPGKA